MAAHESLGDQFALMSSEEYEAAAGPGRQWVYHAGTDPEAFTHGVRMENVPRNLARMRYEKGEYAEFAPGAGIGKGTYVGKEPHVVSGFGHHQWAFSVPKGSLETPPESGMHRPGGAYDPHEDTDFYLGSSTGALLTRNLGRQWIVPMGRSSWSAFTGHEEHQLRAMSRGLHVPEHLHSGRVRDYLRQAKANDWDWRART